MNVYRKLIVIRFFVIWAFFAREILVVKQDNISVIWFVNKWEQSLLDFEWKILRFEWNEIKRTNSDFEWNNKNMMIRIIDGKWFW